MPKYCMFCGINSESKKDHICSTCVQILLSTTQDSMKASYVEAVHKEAYGKAWAIESFLMDRNYMRNVGGKRPWARG